MGKIFSETFIKYHVGELGEQAWSSTKKYTAYRTSTLFSLF
jgi:hypothetical protein